MNMDGKRGSSEEAELTPSDLYHVSYCMQLHAMQRCVYEIKQTSGVDMLCVVSRQLSVQCRHE